MSYSSAIKTWIELVTMYSSDKVIREYGGGPEPSGNFIAFSLPDSDDTSPAFCLSRDSDGDVVTSEWTQPVDLAISVSVFAEIGRELLTHLKTSVGEFTYRKLLNDNGLTLRNTSGIRNLTRHGDTGVEHHFQRDFIFAANESHTETDHELTIVEFTGKLIDDKTGEHEETYSIDLT